MTEFRADLHCHTTCSDGTSTPQQIIELACEKGLKGLSITDHDTIEAYREALPLAQARNIPLLSGVEFSAVHREISVHLLAYAFSLDSPIIKDFCSKHHLRRLERNQAILERLSKHGMPLTLEDVHPNAFLQSSLGRPHIAQAMVKKGYTSSIQQAFNDYIGEGKSCYIAGGTFSVEETLNVIHRAKGLAIIAHPHLIQETKLIKELLEMSFDGIEGYYGRFPRTQHERWIKIGQKRGWIITGGSDFHGEIKPNLPLGSSWVNEETFSVLYSHFKLNQIPSIS